MSAFATIAGEGPSPPLWTALPFAAYVLALSILPLVAARFWERNRNKLLAALIFSIPVAAYLLSGPSHGPTWLEDSLREYGAFVALLASLYIITGGIRIRGSVPGTPLANTGLMGLGALLASFVGTTGASMLLIRPLLRANEARARRAHIVVFFIFIVANAGGLLTPLGDPPLFLGFLRGVPFLWTFTLIGPWLVVNGALLALFNIVDQLVLAREERERPGAQLEEVQRVVEPIRIEGAHNVLFLLGVPLVIYAMGTLAGSMSDVSRKALQAGALAALALLSLGTTPAELRRANRFTWGPIAEVAVVFLGVFVTMVPALKILEQRGGELGLREPWQFFWTTGLLSSVLDNAPTYLTFGSLAVGVVNAMDPGAGLAAERMGELLRHPPGELFLKAISCGAVFMGANTYIGNGPNFMVKAIAEEQKVRMPSFFGYLLWSLPILLPVFALVTFLFFRS